MSYGRAAMTTKAAEAVRQKRKSPGMGTNPLFNFRLHPEVAERLDRVVRRTRGSCTRSDVMRAALEEYLDRMEEVGAAS